MGSKRSLFRFIAVMKTKAGFVLKGIPENRLDSAPGKYFSFYLYGEKIKTWIIRLNGKVHKNSGSVTMLPKKYASVISMAIKHGVSQVHGI